jgi:hypothetical protein
MPLPRALRCKLRTCSKAHMLHHIATLAHSMLSCLSTADLTQSVVATERATQPSVNTKCVLPTGGSRAAAAHCRGGGRGGRGRQCCRHCGGRQQHHRPASGPGGWPRAARRQRGGDIRWGQRERCIRSAECRRCSGVSRGTAAGGSGASKAHWCWHPPEDGQPRWRQRDTAGQTAASGSIAHACKTAWRISGV